MLAATPPNAVTNVRNHFGRGTYDGEREQHPDASTDRRP